MASLIPGYEYDIFISYRQKDNKGDRWVSEFVDALKDELESTFKEEISVYFDENPHDRLQDTHNVDKSLEDKLKCLIFIPIISQTYCDPGCYAWQYEFLAFNRLAEKDQLGKAYHKTMLYKKEKKLYKRAEKDFPDNIFLIYRQFILSLAEGDSIEANKYFSRCNNLY
ncbi:MAG TPA: hypothetical protein VMV77_18505 [Bacteroidales bacterium]|nr:hypothetical protein [Bacteroidales bacterium]